MEQTFLTKVDIKKVRHLHDISIPLSNESRKHLLLTGKMEVEKRVFWKHW